MYFKQLDMVGFKSFADRTQIRLEPGISCIVGPNGSGKSNILDALRWVLGEQRARELRGANMQDVIFNGSEKRHPAGMAEVTITFDNSDSLLPVDFSEVQVTRRVYRSGDSEYLINNVRCRLRDVQELFMDTGIGTQAYSMIGQGKMAQILSQKPEDRRVLFEEAAGIIKYKSRKRIAMRRLENAEQNLVRLADIIAEVERQMRSLKRQVNAAIRYRELTEQLREIEIRSIWLKYREHATAVEELKKQFASAQDALEKFSTQTSTLEARQEALALTMAEQDRLVAERREEVYAMDNELEKLDRQLALLRQQVEFLDKQKEQAETERENALEREQELDAQIAASLALRDEFREKEVACARELEEKEAEAEAARNHLVDIEQEVEAIRKQAAERVSLRERTRSELEALQKALDELEERVQEVTRQQEEAQSQERALREQLDALRETEAAKKDARARLEERYTALQAERAERSERLAALNREWQELREQRSSSESRLNSLRELRDNYEGFATGVRAVMKAKNQEGLQGVIGPAGDLISTEKKYERAIEAALGGNINNVVVEEAVHARDAVQFLKRHKAGRVTFLPLDVIRGGEGDRGQYLQGRPGVIGPVIDYVQFDPHIRPAVEYLLHSTMLVENLDVAIDIIRTEQRYPRLVTLDGEMVSSAGAVTGGHTRHESRGLLGRSAEITELENRVRELVARIQAIGEEGEQLTREIQERTEAIQSVEKERDALTRELNELDIQLARGTTELQNMARSIEVFTRQREALQARLAETRQQRQNVLTRSDSLESDDEAFQQVIEATREKAAAARDALNACMDQVNEIRIRQAGIQHQVASCERELERLEREKTALLEQMRRREEALQEHEKRREQLQQEIRNTIAKARELSEQREARHTNALEADNQRAELRAEQEEIEKALRTVREQAAQAQQQVHRVELDLRTREERIAAFQERILAEYNIALASLREEEIGTDEYDDETRDRLVQDIRARLQRMGSVNLGAPEEYAELEKRYEFLTGQCADLEQARDTLLGVIARSDRKIREMFLETFTQIADAFREYFRRLFNGGQARVYLVDEDDPLESGIEIEARPPGKKPTSISQLSGGESAMTAIALLMAILYAKPTPFCVLDEVDAPLDDANIGRFLDIIDEFAEKSQFIIITHNKQSMARADVLYGITMQERGVSQVISARLTDENESGTELASAG